MAKQGAIEVFLEATAVGCRFGFAGVVRRVGSRRRIAVARDVYGSESPALAAAARLARERGWTVCDAGHDGTAMP